MSVSPRVRRIVSPRPEEVPADEVEFLRWLGGPSWIELPGRDPGRTRAVSALIHGNEPSGPRAVHAWLRSGRTPAVNAVILLPSVRAALEPPGFAHRSLPGHTDLNRCFLPPHAGEEGALAAELLEILHEAKPEALVDLHNNTGHNPPYGVGPAADAASLALVALFGRYHVHSDLRLGALVEATHHHHPSVTIECGRAGDASADAVAIEGLSRYLDAESLESLCAGPEPVERLRDPIRVTARPGLTLGFGEGPDPRVDFTVAADVDRHNFERLPPGVAIGWVREGDRPLEARDLEGRDRAPELFAVRDGVLETRREMIPIMMTTDARIALSDCLFYIVRR